MANALIRSTKALSVISRFERVPVVLYVEGPTDRIIWEHIFDIFSINNVKVKPAGNCIAVDKYINDIIDNRANIFVARDKDYRFHLGKIRTHDRVLLTYGHSIENTTLCPSTIDFIAWTNGASKNYYKEKYTEWLEGCVRVLKKAIAFEFANEKSGVGCSVLGETCDRFMSGKKSTLISEEKINELINQIESEIDSNDIEECLSLCDKLGDELKYFIRGHFVFSATSRFVKNMMKEINHVGKDISISNDSLQMMLNQAFYHIMNKRTHPQFSYYEKEIAKIKNILESAH